MNVLNEERSKKRFQEIPGKLKWGGPGASRQESGNPRMIGELSGIITRRHIRRPGRYQWGRGIIIPGDMSQEDSFQETRARENPPRDKIQETPETVMENRMWRWSKGKFCNEQVLIVLYANTGPLAFGEAQDSRLCSSLPRAKLRPNS